ncbi:hypothetical protein DL98DRAFT_467265 [Cadophora sp. DSE1049]|nr:hypothetical protein DL98DRAFT_467265 [Cadophora sp. DSE1049]
MGQTHYLSETPFTYEMSCKYGTTSTQPSGLGDGDSKASNGYATELRAMPQNSNVSGGILGYRDRFDTTGQVAPPGTKPRVTATLWEDEGALCYQVEARGVCVARREADNHMINGTKLLNIAGMTRGRRDGILKSEKIRHVVKIGPMQMKGVWYFNQHMWGASHH